ncbi:MAG: nuclear transport factor 2 family protein [Trueperaceae bacterium]
MVEPRTPRTRITMQYGRLPAGESRPPRTGVRLAGVIALVAFLVAGVAWAQTPDHDAILAIGPAFEDAFAEGDVEALGAMYVEDALYIASGGTVLEGPEGVVGLFTAFREADFVAIDLESMKVQVSGDMAFSAGAWTLTHASGTTMSGYYTNAYVRTDDGWRIAHTGGTEKVEEESADG